MKRIFKNKWVIAAVVVVILVGLRYWYTATHQPKYQSYTVAQGPITETLELSGKVQVAASANLSFAAGGLVSYVGAKEGDTVRKGQTIAVVDTRTLQKILEEKLNTYVTALNNFDQTKANNQSALDANTVDDTLRRILANNQYSLDNAVKDVEYQNLLIQLSAIYSPINGILVQSGTDTAGATVGPTAVWQIVDPTSLEFVADLDETDLKNVSVGQKVILTLDAYPGLSIDSTIGSISYFPVETTTGTTYEVKVKIPSDKMPSLRLGLNGTAAIVLSEKADTAYLPLSALTQQGSNATVLVKSGKSYVTKTIQTGIADTNNIEVDSGLGVGDRVYVKQ